MADAAALYYGICTSTASSSTKYVECSGFVLEKGAKILVLMTQENTTGSIKISVNDTTAKQVVTKFGNSVTSSNSWQAGDYIFLTYNGTQWIWVNSNEIANTTQGNVFTTSTATTTAVTQDPGQHPFKLGFFSSTWTKGNYGEKWIVIKASDLGLTKIYGAVASPIRSSLSYYSVGLAVKITSTSTSNSVYVGLDENDSNCEGLFVIAWGV